MNTQTCFNMLIVGVMVVMGGMLLSDSCFQSLCFQLEVVRPCDYISGGCKNTAYRNFVWESKNRSIYVSQRSTSGIFQKKFETGRKSNLYFGP